MLFGTTQAAVKAVFLKEIILGESVVKEITPAFYLSYYHMKVDLRLKCYLI
jgi:aconitate hydratase 2/2-methylisocitrate dehydratase